VSGECIPVIECTHYIHKEMLCRRNGDAEYINGEVLNNLDGEIIITYLSVNFINLRSEEQTQNFPVIISNVSCYRVAKKVKLFLC
jgi:hypothetical protein